MCAGDKLGADAIEFCPETMSFPLADGSRAKIVQQLYRLRKKHNIPDNVMKKVIAEKVAEDGDYKRDWLATSTQMTMKYSQALKDMAARAGITRKLLSSKYIAHLTIVSTLALLCSAIVLKLCSEPVVDRNDLWTVIYLASFAMHFGAQIWMTMVSGLVLYFSLPRHIFGNVQEHLFPAFYTFSSCVSFVMVIAFARMQPELTLKSKSFIQIVFMIIAFAIELCIRLYIAHAVVALKHTKTRMEMAAGTGQEIGVHILGDLAKCPHYMNILRRFRRLHSYTSIATLFLVSCSVYHVHYLAQKICM